MWQTQGRLQDNLGKSNESMEWISKNCEIFDKLEPTVGHPEFKQHHAITRINLAKILIRRNDPNGSVAELNRAIEILRTLMRVNRPGYVSLWLDAHYVRGAAHWGKSRASKGPMGQPEAAAAIADFTEVILETSRSVGSGYTAHLELLLRALHMRHTVYVQLGQQKNAIADAEQASAESERHAYVLPISQIDNLRAYVGRNPKRRAQNERV